MCEYCDESKNRKDIDDNGEIKVRLNEQMGNNLEIDYYYYGTKVGRYIPRVYCPMCGRLVNEELLIKIQKSVNIPKTEIPTGISAGIPVTTEIDFNKEIANAIIKSIDPTNIANNITKNIMRGGM